MPMYMFQAAYTPQSWAARSRNLRTGWRPSPK
jgi:hypothetical protein